MSLVVDHIAPIRADDEYGGFRIAIMARYETINTPLKIDLTSGDIITPEAVRYNFHSNFEDKTILVWTYNIETILAEKVETILRRSVLNTRPRDFYDVYILLKARQDAINMDVFKKALSATSEKRGSQVALQNRENILHNIQGDSTMRRRWERYCQEYFYANGIVFKEVIQAIVSLTGNENEEN